MPGLVDGEPFFINTVIFAAALDNQQALIQFFEKFMVAIFDGKGKSPFIIRDGRTDGQPAYPAFSDFHGSQQLGIENCIMPP